LISAESTSDDDATEEEDIAPRKIKNIPAKNAMQTSTSFRFVNYKITEENWVMYTIEITNG
jgi:hypothetical protein